MKFHPGEVGSDSSPLDNNGHYDSSLFEVPSLSLDEVESSLPWLKFSLVVRATAELSHRVKMTSFDETRTEEAFGTFHTLNSIYLVFKNEFKKSARFFGQ